MTETSAPPPHKLSWRFPRSFWIANVIELFERAAYYGMFLSLTLALTTRVGFTDKQAGLIGGTFAFYLYFLTPFSGALADRIGFRRALMLAFALLSSGYFLLGLWPYKVETLGSLALIMCGGSLVKPVISGNVAHCSDDAHRARAFSIFYLIVNVGGTLGQALAKPLRTGVTLPYLGRLELGLGYINYYASFMAFIALLMVIFFFRDVKIAAPAKSAMDTLLGLVKVVRNFRFMSLIVIIAGFWVIQGQLYATMVKYVLRLLGDQASPEWQTMINPIMVVVLVIPIAHLVRNFKAEVCIGISLFMIAFSALLMGSSVWLEDWFGRQISFGGMLSLHPVVLAMIVGVAIMSLAECFLSPKFMEFASKQAPPGEVGLYMGYTGLSTCIAWFLGFVISGELLDKYCPDPAKLSAELQQQRLAAIASGGPLPEVYAHAHYIWYVFAGIGAAAFLALLLFSYMSHRLSSESSKVGKPLGS